MLPLCILVYCHTTVGDGDEILVMIEPGPAVGAARVVHPFATVNVMGVHGAIDRALNGFLTQGHHRTVPEGEDLLHLVGGGRGDCVGVHRFGLN